MKKDLTAFFGKGKRSPGPTTAGNPIKTVIQRHELQRGTLTGKGDSGAGAGGTKDDNNGWRTPLVKKKRVKSNTTPQDAEGEEGQNNKKPRSGDEESAGLSMVRETTPRLLGRTPTFPACRGWRTSFGQLTRSCKTSQERIGNSMLSSETPSITMMAVTPTGGLGKTKTANGNACTSALLRLVFPFIAT